MRKICVVNCILLSCLIFTIFQAFNLYWHIDLNDASHLKDFFKGNSETHSIIKLIKNKSANLELHSLNHQLTTTTKNIYVNEHLEKKDVHINAPSITKPMVLVLCDTDHGAKGENNDLKLFRGRRTINLKTKKSWKRQRTQLKTMLGSLLFFSQSPIWRIVAITDSLSTFQFLTNITQDWSQESRNRLRFERYISDFKMPQNDFLNEWRPCSWTKIFLPEILKEFDSVVYIDTDFVFVGPAEDIWDEFPKMKTSQVVGIGPEPWYEYEMKLNLIRSFAGKRGLNTGLLLYNLTRARSIPQGGFSNGILKEIRYTLGPRHDQDIVNSYFHEEPQFFMELSPRFNFLPSVCILNVSCIDCQEKGIVAVHGADASFYSGVDPRWQVIFSVLSELTAHLDTNSKNLLSKLQNQLNFLQNTKKDGSCLKYNHFNDMILYQLKMMTH